jgi:23S rRNA pseudouridine2605 synthase
MPIRIQKFIRDATGISRRAVEDEIKLGKVFVNNKPAKLGQVIDDQKDQVVLNGKRIISLATKEFKYVMLNKPAGYLTSRYDPHHAQTVYNLLPPEFKKLVPAGRLDKDSEGLLLFSDDGDFIFRLTHPKFEVEKEYFVILDTKLMPEHKTTIEQGLSLPNLKTSPAKIEINRLGENETQLIITIHEGQNREVRRMFGKFGYNVTYLKRLRMGNYTLNDLQVGQWAYVSNTL